MTSNVVFTSPHTAYTEAMRLDSNGNLGIGMGNNQRGQITLHDGVETATLTIELLKELKKFAGFVEYAKQCDKDLAKLWTAYEIANKLET